MGQKVNGAGLQFASPLEFNCETRSFHKGFERPSESADHGFTNVEPDAYLDGFCP